MKNKKRIRERGITLVALVITIIVLLILAGISIQALTQTNLFDKTKQAKNAMENAQNVENETLSSYESEVEKYLPGGKKQTTDISALTYEKNESNKTLTITGFQEGKDVENLIIASKYKIDGVEYTVTVIRGMAFIDNETLKTVYVPETVSEFGEIDDRWRPFLRCWNLEKVEVAENNANYKSVNGVVYTKDMSELVFYPGGKKDIEYTIPDTVTKTQYSSLYFDTFGEEVELNLTKITIPNSVTDLYLRGWYEGLVVKWNNKEYSHSDMSTFQTEFEGDFMG